VTLVVTTALVVPEGAQSVQPQPPSGAATTQPPAESAQAAGVLKPCLERPVSWRWAIDSTVGSFAAKPLAGVSIINIEAGRSRTLPSFRSLSTGGPGRLDFHATAMVSLLVDNQVGIVGSSYNILVKSVGYGSGESAALAREVEAAVRAAGVINDKGDTKGAHRRLVLSLPLGSTSGLAATRKWIAAGLRSGRVLTIAASGNEASAVLQPGSFPEVLTVGGAGPDGTLWRDAGPASGSNVGPAVDLLGPGCQVVVRVDPTDIPPSVKAPGTPQFPDRPMPGPDYRVTTGTSGATAIVAGAAALLWASQPTLHAVQVKRLLQSSGREQRSDARGFGVASLERIELDTAVPRIELTRAGKIVKVRITDPDLVPAGADGLEGSWPHSAIAKVAWSTDANPTKWNLVDPVTAGRATYERQAAPCKNVCQLAIPEKGSVLTVRAIDSAAFAELGGAWDGTSGRFGEAKLSIRGTSPVPTTRSVSPTTVGSRPPTTTTRTTTTIDRAAVLAAYEAWVQGFVPYIDRWVAARDAIAAVAPPTLPAAGNSGPEYSELRMKLKPLIIDLCKVNDEIRERIFGRWPGYPFSPRESPDQHLYGCTPGLAGSGINYAMLIEPRGTPIGTSKYYQRDFRVWDMQTARLRAFVAGQPLPPYPQ
jgi:hypothetical protein